ncbi:hypothetical protein M404DRAFT_161183, partial [Pisolithus tinctorius Marx 270]
QGVSKEDIEDFWLSERPRLFNPPEITKKILKYEQAHANEVVVSKALVDSGLIVAPFDGMVTFEALTEIFTSEEYRKTVGVESMKNFERGGQMFSANFAIIIDNQSGRVPSFLRTRKLNQWPGMVRVGKGQLERA